MTKLLEHAVDSVRALPPEVQDELARLLLQVAGEEQPVILLTSEERADLAEADAEIARGEFATDEQMRSILAKRPVWDCASQGARRRRSRRRSTTSRPIRPRRQTMFASELKLFSVCWRSTPYAGQATDLPGVRRLTLSPYPHLIFYRVTDSEVIVQRMRHTSRRSRSASDTP